ncbi:hypothetical protein LPJ75_003762, partial [Coemansia sp. RSA 2598]
MDSNAGINGSVSSQPSTGGSNPGLGMLNLRYGAGVPTTMAAAAAAVAAMGQMAFAGSSGTLGSISALHPGQHVQMPPPPPPPPQQQQQQQPLQQPASVASSSQQNPSMLLHQQLLLNSGWPLHHPATQMSHIMG